MHSGSSQVHNWRCQHRQIDTKLQDASQYEVIQINMWIFSLVCSGAEHYLFAYLHCCQVYAAFISLQVFQWFFFFLDSHIISVSLLVDAFLCGILSWFQQSGDLRHFLLFLGVPYYSFWVTWKISNTRQKNEGSHGADMTSFWLKEIYVFQTPYIFICLRKMV